MSCGAAISNLYFVAVLQNTVPMRLCKLVCFTIATRMWANAQRDGRPSECKWRPVLNAANFGRRPLLKCRTVTLPRRETR